MKTHHLIRIKWKDRKDSLMVKCNGNGVPDLSLGKRYNLTENEEEVNCKSCLKGKFYTNNVIPCHNCKKRRNKIAGGN